MISFKKTVAILPLFMITLLFSETNEYGMESCDSASTNGCVPTVDGKIRGNVSSSPYHFAKYQTNLYGPKTLYNPVDSYANFSSTPFYQVDVAGDYAITGNSVMSFRNSSSLDFASSDFLNDDTSGNFIKNSSNGSLFLPPKLKPQDIVWARVFWSGNIHTNQLTGNVPRDVPIFSCTNLKQSFIPNEYAKESWETRTPRLLKSICESAYPNNKSVCANLIFDGSTFRNLQYYPDGYGGGSNPNLIGGLAAGNIFTEVYQKGTTQNFCEYNHNRVINQTTLTLPGGKEIIISQKRFNKYNDCKKKYVCLNWSLTTRPKVSAGGLVPSKDVADYIQPLINGYRNMKLKANNVGVKEFTSTDDDTFYSYSFNNQQSTGSLYFLYAASADATDFVKDVIRKNSNYNSGVNITGGDVISTTGAVSSGSDRWLNGKQLSRNTSIANFGSWSLVVVYDKKNQSDVSSSEYETYYRQKRVSIYKGFATLIADNNKKAEATFKFDNFFTPNKDDFNAKLSTYAVSMVGYDDAARGYVQIQFKDNNDRYTDLLNPRGGNYLEGSISFIKPGEKEPEEILRNNWTTIGLDTYEISKNLTKKQTKTSIKYGVNNNNGKGEQSFLNMVAFSTDLYVPSVCYKVDVYNAKGEKNKFKAVKGEVLRTYLTVKNQKRTVDEGDEALGLKINAILGDELNYFKNSMRVNNTSKDANPFNKDNKNLVYIIDNKPGTYKKDPRGFEYIKCTESEMNNPSSGCESDGFRKATEQELKASLQKIMNPGSDHTQLNSYKTTNTNDEVLYIYLGKDAGNVTSTGAEPNGGSLAENAESYVYYETIATQGGKFDPEFYVFFRSNDINLDYGGRGIKMGKCGDDETKKIEIIDIDNLKVVNEKYGQKNNNTNLFTQVAGKSFNTKLLFDYSKRIEGEEDDNETEEVDPSGLKGLLEISLIDWEELNKKYQGVNPEEICRMISDSDRIPFKIKKWNGSDKIINGPSGDSYQLNTGVDWDNNNLAYQFELDKLININDIKLNLANKKLTFMVSYYPDGNEKYQKCISACKTAYAQDIKVCTSNDLKCKTNAIEKLNKCQIEGCKVGDEQASLIKYMNNYFKNNNSENFLLLNERGGYNVCNGDFFSSRPKYIQIQKDSIVSNDHPAGANLDLSNLFYPVSAETNTNQTDDKLFVLGYDSNFGTKDIYNDLKRLATNSFIIPVVRNTCNLSNIANVKDKSNNTLWSSKDIYGIVADFSKNNAGKNDIDIYKSKTYSELNDIVSMNLNKRYAEVNVGGQTNPNIFKYYNIGYVALRLYDNSWTVIDQNKKDPSKSDCIINSTSNNAVDGKVGCDIATHFDNFSTNMDINITNQFKMSNFSPNPMWTDALTKDQENRNSTFIPLRFAHDHIEAAISDINQTNGRQNDDGKLLDYYYFNSLANPKNSKPYTNLDAISKESLGMGAHLKIDTKAVIPYDKNETLTPTLYSSGCYANDVSFNIDFNPNCDGNKTLRCDANGTIKAYYGPEKEGLVDNIHMRHPSDDSKIVYIDNNNLDADGKLKISYKQASFTDGKFAREDLLFNFYKNVDKGNASLPQRIFAEDFQPTSTPNLKEGSAFKDPILSLGTNIFKSYDGRNDTNNTFENPTDGYADFYYGYANIIPEKNGDRELDCGDGEECKAKVGAFVYCADDTRRSCGIFNLTKGDPTFSITINSNTLDFYKNKDEVYTNEPTITNEFVANYNSADGNITDITRNFLLRLESDNFEEVELTPEADVLTGKVLINAQPYLLGDDNQLHNDFIVNFHTASGWAGEGGTKKDDVGMFLDSNDTKAKKRSIPRGRNSKIIW